MPLISCAVRARMLAVMIVVALLLSALGASAFVPEERIEWAGGWRATFSGTMASATQAENLAIAYTAPLAGKFYVEVSLLFDDENGQPIGSIGVWNVAGTPRDPGEWANIGQLYGNQSCGVVNDGADTLFALTNGEGFKRSAVVHADGWPVVRYGIAGDAATGKVWIRQVWPDGVGTYIGDGDPVLGAAPTSEPALSGGAPRIAAGIPVGATATIHARSEHLGAAPAGFTAR